MQINREIKRNARNDKRKCVENLVSRTQIAADKNNGRELYNITKTLANKNSVRNCPIKNKNGQLFTTAAEQLNRWKEHFGTAGTAAGELGDGGLFSITGLQKEGHLQG